MDDFEHGSPFGASSHIFIRAERFPHHPTTGFHQRLPRATTVCTQGDGPCPTVEGGWREIARSDAGFQSLEAIRNDPDADALPGHPKLLTCSVDVEDRIALRGHGPDVRMAIIGGVNI